MPHAKYYPTVVQWLQTAANPEIAARLYRELLRPSQRETFATRALNWVSTHLEVRGAHEVLMRLIPLRDGEPQFDDAVDAWLGRFGDSSLAPPVLAELLDKGRLAYWAPWAMRYLDANEGAPGSQMVMSSAIAAISSAKAQVLNEIQEGLSRHEAAVFQRLRRKVRRT